MNYSVRAATPKDGEAILALLPRLAAFEVPDYRVPEDLWRSDEQLLRRWLGGSASDCLVHVAESDSGAIIGLALAKLQPEMLSREPSAHLEAIAVAAEAEGHGIGQALLSIAESAARERGAKTMSLHVFATNLRARNFYDRSGYCGELIRYTKSISE